MESFCDLRQKEVINICDGMKYGNIRDIEIDIKTARVLSIIVPKPGKLFGLLCPEAEYRIPWVCIKKIGDDIILVDIGPEELLKCK